MTKIRFDQIDGYIHAQPVFPADTKVEDLPDLLKAWKINQDAVDLENANRTTPEEAPIKKEITDLIGKEI